MPATVAPRPRFSTKNLSLGISLFDALLALVRSAVLFIPREPVVRGAIASGEEKLVATGETLLVVAG